MSDEPIGPAWGSVKPAMPGMPNPLAPPECDAFYARCPEFDPRVPLCSIALETEGAVVASIDERQLPGCGSTAAEQNEGEAVVEFYFDKDESFGSIQLRLSSDGPSSAHPVYVTVAMPDGKNPWVTTEYGDCTADVEKSACMRRGQPGMRYRFTNGTCSWPERLLNPPGPDLIVTAFSGESECVVPEPIPGQDPQPQTPRQPECGLGLQTAGSVSLPPGNQMPECGRIEPDANGGDLLRETGQMQSAAEPVSRVAGP